MSAPLPKPEPNLWRWSHWPFGVKVAGAAAIVIALAGIGSAISDGRSSFPSWLEAVATLAALIAAVAAARYAARAFELESLREDRWRIAQEQAQADLVAAWFSFDSGKRAMGPNPAVALVNASPVPVYNVNVILIGIPDLTGAEVNDDVDYVRSLLPSTLGPTGSEPLWVHLTGWQLEAARDAIGRQASASVQLDFTDARGQRWLRRTDGRLLNISGDEW